MVRIGRRGVGLAAAATAMHARGAAAATQRYVDPDYGFSIDYPADEFGPSEPVRGDRRGARFFTPDRQAWFVVYGRENTEGHSLAELIEEEALVFSVPGSRITYRREGAGWFVLSGLAQRAAASPDRVFYVRVQPSRGGRLLNVLRVDYPVGWKARFDPVVGVLSRSFRTGTG